MKKFFVSYIYQQNGLSGYANDEVVCTGYKLTIEVIRKIEESLREKYNFTHAVVLNVVLLEA
jgi:hypothetical protein